MNADELLKLMQTRRSVRAFDPDRKIPSPTLRRIIEAGIWAPTGSNQQELRFAIVQDRALIEEFRTFKKVGLPAALVLIYIDFGSYYAQYGPSVKHEPHKRPLPYIDTGLAMMNMMLMAESLSIRSVPLNVSSHLYRYTWQPRGLPGRALRRLVRLSGVSGWGVVAFDAFTRRLGIDFRRYIPSGCLALGYSDRHIDPGVAKHGKRLIQRDEVDAYIIAAL